MLLGIVLVDVFLLLVLIDLRQQVCGVVSHLRVLLLAELLNFVSASRDLVAKFLIVLQQAHSILFLVTLVLRSGKLIYFWFVSERVFAKARAHACGAKEQT